MRCQKPMDTHDEYGRCPPAPAPAPGIGWDEALATGFKVLGRVILWVVVAVVALFVLRWAYTEYWISQHCTDVLGTRVCQ